MPSGMTVKCENCHWEGDASECKDACTVYHDLRCPECGTTELDTSDVNRKMEGYCYGDDNFLRMKKEG